MILQELLQINEDRLGDSRQKIMAVITAAGGKRLESFLDRYRLSNGFEVTITPNMSGVKDRWVVGVINTEGNHIGGSIRTAQKLQSVINKKKTVKESELTELKNPEPDWEDEDDGDEEQDKMKGFNKAFGAMNAKDNPKAYALKQNIGRKVMFKTPTKGSKEYKSWLSSHGTMSLKPHEIVGVQKDYTGKLCYRVVAIGQDDFGRVAQTNAVEFID